MGEGGVLYQLDRVAVALQNEAEESGATAEEATGGRTTRVGVGPKPVRHSLPNPSLLPNPSVFCCPRAFTLVLSCPSTVIAAVHDYVVSRERINPLLVPTAPRGARPDASLV